MAASTALLGTRLRHLLELLDDDVAKVYTDMGLDGFRPRFTPIVRALADQGPMPIRDVARTISVTHSAASQTVNHMVNYGLVVLEPGEDGRQRIVHLTPKALELLPKLDAEWAATTAAAEELEAELPFPLSELVAAAIQALERRPFRQRIADVAR
jgi:DNA-binding MarR family transcriptional regulator